MFYQKVPSYLSQTLDRIDTEKALRDDYAKCLLADPQVLAHIVREAIPVFHDMPTSEILPCIDHPVVTLTFPEMVMQKIPGQWTEDNSETDGKILYDIRFTLFYHGTPSKILLNLEAQRSISFAKLKYHIENRITYYVSRMISAQKNTEFFHSDYDNLKPVYSIWICMDTPKAEDSVMKIGLSSQLTYGISHWQPVFDLIHAVIFRIRHQENFSPSGNTAIAILELLFSKLPAEEKKQLLQDTYGFIMNIETKGCVNEMCNWSDFFEEEAREEGLERGLAEGRALGLSEGLSQGLSQGLSEGLSQGLSQGQKICLISQVIKKVQKGKDVNSASSELEESPETIQPIYAAVLSTPDADANQLYDKLYGSEAIPTPSV